MASTRNPDTRISSSLIGALTASLIVLATGNRHGLSSSNCPQPSRCRWAPHPSSIVNFTYEADEDIDIGQYVDVYSVPADKWLVIQDVMLNLGYELVEESSGQQRIVAHHLSVGVGTPGSSRSLSGMRSDLGYVMRPGSTVQIRKATSYGVTSEPAVFNFAATLVDA